MKALTLVFLNRALENTLRLMNSRNETYRKSFNKVDESSDEFEEKHRLEEQSKAVMDKYKYKRRQIRELQDDLQSMETTLESLTADEGALVEVIDEKQSKVSCLVGDSTGGGVLAHILGGVCHPSLKP